MLILAIQRPAPLFSTGYPRKIPFGSFLTSTIAKLVFSEGAWKKLRATVRPVMMAFALLQPLTSALLLQPQLHAFQPARWRSSPVCLAAAAQLETPSPSTEPLTPPLQEKTVQLIDKLEAADFQHPIDREATAALRALVPVEWAVRQAFRALNVDDASFLDNIAKGVLVGPTQLPALHADLLEACRLLNVEVAPELYVRQDPRPNAYTMAVQGQRPFVVVTTALLDLLEPREVQAVIAHELGHLKCEHGLFLLLSNLLTSVVLGGTVLGAALQT